MFQRSRRGQKPFNKMLQSKVLLCVILVLFCVLRCCCSLETTTTDSNATESNQIFSTGIETTSSTITLDKEDSSTERNDVITTTATNVLSSTEAFSPTIETLVTDLIEKVSTVSTATLGNARKSSEREDFVSTTLRPETTTPDLLGKWKHFENITKIFAKAAVKSMLPGLMEGSGNLNVSDSCRRDVLKLIIGIKDIKTWAFSFIDASGKIIDGMLSGTMGNLGEYDQCLNIKATNDRRGKNFGKTMFTGKYCAIDIAPPLPPKKRYYKLTEIADELKEFAAGGNVINEAAKSAQFFHFLTMRLGVCVPSGCGPSDIQQVMNIVAKETYWTFKVKRCELKEDNVYTPLIIGVMTAMCFFGFMLVVGSLIDLYHRHAQKKITNVALEILTSFSLPSNFKKLMNTGTKNNMSCLHGLRFLSITWVILGHTYLNVNYSIFRGLKKATEYQVDFFFQAVVNASVAVDTFFFVGGLLVCYVTVKVVRESKKPFSIFLYLLHRIFRLLPVYIMIIAFIYLAPILGSGPVYKDTIDPFLESCYKNWWTNVLFVNNFVNTDQICLPQSWYVACDMQLYIAALVILLPMLRWPWIGLTLASLGIVASVAGSMFMTYINNYPPTMLFVHPDIEQRLAFWADSYFKPYSHAGPYCIGIIVGYVLATHPKLKFRLLTRIGGWSIAIICNMAVLYGVHEWNKGRDPELVETLLYSGLHRIAWTIGIAWIVLVCASGQGGVVNYILSWKFWIPLGRLTYTIYLIHPIVQIAAVGNVRMNTMIHHYFAVWIFFGHLMITTGSAFAASMLVEAPFIKLEKLFLRALVGKPQNTPNGHIVMPSDLTQPKTINSEETGAASSIESSDANETESGMKTKHTNGTIERTARMSHL